MKVLVTGGTGMVGRCIRDEISKRDDFEKWTFVGSNDADLRSYHATLNLFEREKPTHVIHLAAVVGGLYKNLKDNLEMFRTNAAINTNVLRTAHETGVEKVSKLTHRPKHVFLIL